ncbi:Polysialic acid capsule expression protein [Scheffersomyces xylosifermentans]|uniref:Polysialic acid capsule expression protein n=1 Tax=Scheffersomyces xylosifermentans TaxID=1304137 RepID=UPI00315C896D
MSPLAKKAFESVNNTLKYQSDAVQNLYLQYQNDAFSQANLQESLNILFTTNYINHGRIVICGIGKSFKIANKLVATLNSLSIHAAELHPSEALHGDLGLINESKDCLILLTASGNTSELLQLLPHLSPSLPIILLTCNRDSKLSNHPQVNSLLYAALPSYLNEETIHGLPAPTVSTTLSLILADATILALSEMIEDDLLKRKKQFSMKHPGGSIGSYLSHLNDNLNNQPSAVPLRKAISSQVSNSSLLSLNQIAQNFKSTSLSVGNSTDNKSHISSLTSSDDECSIMDIKESARSNVDVVLTNAIKMAEPEQSKVIAQEDIALLKKSDELKVLQWITLFDFLIIDMEKLLAIETTTVKQLYKSKFADSDRSDDSWSKFHWELMRSFKDIDI